MMEGVCISRVRQACEACKQGRRKCDGNRPCGRCVRLRKECLYVAKSLPRPRQGSVAVSKKQKQKHENQLILRGRGRAGLLTLLPFLSFSDEGLRLLASDAQRFLDGILGIRLGQYFLAGYVAD